MMFGVVGITFLPVYLFFWGFFLGFFLRGLSVEVDSLSSWECPQRDG